MLHYRKGSLHNSTTSDQWVKFVKGGYPVKVNIINTQSTLHITLLLFVLMLLNTAS